MHAITQRGHKSFHGATSSVKSFTPTSSLRIPKSLQPRSRNFLPLGRAGKHPSPKCELGGAVCFRTYSLAPWFPCATFSALVVLPFEGYQQENLDRHTHIYSRISVKAFSALRHNSEMLHDPEARQFFKVRDEISRCKPPMFLLENVLGLLRVKTQVMKHLNSAGEYYIHVCVLDPLHFSCPLSRRRVFFIGVRRDLVQNPNDAALKGIAERTVEATSYFASLSCF